MTWLLIAIGVLSVFAVAAAFVGTEAFRLGHETPAAIFDLDEAVSVVGDRLADDVQARVTFDEVRQLILATLDHLRSKGITALPGEDMSRNEADVIVRDEDVLAVVLGVVEAQGLGVADSDAAHVIDGLLRHLDEIGALGPPA
ncbi:MAG: hypothetical protein WD691_12350 [Acidimicrobiales bacterium]